MPSAFLQAPGLATADQRVVAGHGWALHTPGSTRSCSAPCQPPRCWCEAGPTPPLTRTQPPGEIRAAVARSTHAQPLHSLGRRLLWSSRLACAHPVLAKLCGAVEAECEALRDEQEQTAPAPPEAAATCRAHIHAMRTPPGTASSR